MDTRTRNSIGVYAGAFDPFTVGHLNIATRAAEFFDKLIISVAADTSGKRTALSLDDRRKIAEIATRGIDNVVVESFDGLLTDYMASVKSKTLVRGVRDVKDFEYEKNLEAVYKTQSDIEVIYFTARAELSHVSSSAVRELCGLNGNIDGYVAEGTKEIILKRLNGRR